jgi:hypothetical protein
VISCNLAPVMTPCFGCAGKDARQLTARRSSRRYVDIESIYKRNSKTTSNLLSIAHKKSNRQSQLLSAK